MASVPALHAGPPGTGGIRTWAGHFRMRRILQSGSHSEKHRIRIAPTLGGGAERPQEIKDYLIRRSVGFPPEGLGGSGRSVGRTSCASSFTSPATAILSISKDMP